MKLSNQQQKIMAYLNTGKRLTNYIGFAKLKITNTPKRVSELISYGEPIDKEWRKTKRWRVREYFIKNPIQSEKKG